MEIINKLHKLFLLLFVMKNTCAYFSVRWNIINKAKVFFKTKPDKLFLEINQLDISENKITESLYIISKLVNNGMLYSYNKQRNDIGICAFNRKATLKFELFSLANIVYPALNAGIFIEEYNKEFFLATVMDKLKFIIRRKNKSDLLILRDTFVYEDYSKYLPANQNIIILDIGGYIGDTAIYFSQLGASMVYVYEPHPTLYELMVKNIELNNLKNIKTVNCGVSDKDSIMSIKEDGSFDGPTASFGLKPRDKSEGRTVKIKVASLKAVIEGIGQIDFMKMDCEGSELPAILSCDRACLKRIKKMVVEFHDDPEVIVTHLRENGFLVKTENQFLVASLL